MRKLIIWFTVFFVLALLARILFEYYIETVPAFGTLLTPLTWLCVGFGVLDGLFIALVIIKAFKKHKGD